jgi:hypothetical protein
MIRRRRQGWTTRWEFSPLAVRLAWLVVIVAGALLGGLTAPFGIVSR